MDKVLVVKKPRKATRKRRTIPAQKRVYEQPAANSTKGVAARKTHRQKPVTAQPAVPKLRFVGRVGKNKGLWSGPLK